MSNMNRKTGSQLAAAIVAHALNAQAVANFMEHKKSITLHNVTRCANPECAVEGGAEIGLGRDGRWCRACRAASEGKGAAE